MRKKVTLSSGYTIIELLAVLSILVVISGIISGIIYSTLRGSAKSQITTDVSQNGQYAVSVLSGIISDSRNVTQVNGADMDDCTAVPTSDNVTPPPGGNSPSITFRRLDGGVTTISCQTIGAYTIASNGASLIDTSKVKVAVCLFSCSQEASDPYSIPIVNISFNISEKSGGLFENKSSANFNFSSSLRVYSP